MLRTSESIGLEVAKQDEPSLKTEGPITLADLLSTIDRKAGISESMLVAVATRFLEFVGSTPEAVRIDLISVKKEAFIAHLKAGKYKASSVKSYRNYLNLLLRRAEKLGWVRPTFKLPSHWQTIAAALSTKRVGTIIRYAAELGRTPALFSEEDLSAWRQTRVKAGLSLTNAEGDCSRFRSAIARADLSAVLPLIRPRDRRYGIPLDRMHPQLRQEIQKVIAWKLNEFQIDRPSGARIRPISAKRLKDLFAQLVGYLQNIEHEPEVESLAGLVTRQCIVNFTTWATNERKVKGQSLSTGLGMVYAALRHNPVYADLDLTWFENIIGQLPVESQSIVDERKGKKYISYAIAEEIPKRIREKRMKLKSPTSRAQALLIRDELLTKWILLLPWRQRNIRELRVSGEKANLVKAPISKYCASTKPRWITEKERESPGSTYWQVSFTPNETKMHHSVKLFVPAELLPLLEEYVSKHRCTLVGTNDPGTLFVGNSGKAMNVGQFRNLIKKLASQHAGVPVTPHIYRDIVAFEWLRTHPEDYLTVSKVLWHRNINTTIRIYGHRFDESTGVARMEDWRADPQQSLGRGSLLSSSREHL